MRPALVLLSVLFLASCGSDEAKRSFDAGARALQRGDWGLCIEENTNAIRHNRRMWEAYVNRALCYLELNRGLEAVDDAAAAIALNDTALQAYLVRADAYDAIGRPHQAEADLKRALQLDPRDVRVWIGWTHHHMRNRNFERALADIDSTLRLAPGYETAFSLKGSVLIMSKAYAEAIGWLKDEASRTGPMQAINVTNLGFAEAQLGRLQEAKSHLELAVRLDSMSSIAWNNLGYVTFSLGDVNAGKAMVDRAIMLDPMNSYAHYNRGLVALAEGDTLDACDRFRNALDLGFARDHGPEADSMFQLSCVGVRGL